MALGLLIIFDLSFASELDSDRLIEVGDTE